jgi:hypothetical protein
VNVLVVAFCRGEGHLGIMDAWICFLFSANVMFLCIFIQCQCLCHSPTELILPPIAMTS